MQQVHKIVEKLAEERQVYIDQTWNWKEYGAPTPYALCEVEYGLSLEVPSVRVWYYGSESELIDAFLRESSMFAVPGYRDFLLVINEEILERY
jgi:hypothetical protein